jgi:hypothetical protein
MRRRRSYYWIMGPTLKQKRRDGETVLHWAAFKGHEATLRLLLENVADIKAKDGDGGMEGRHCTGRRRMGTRGLCGYCWRKGLTSRRRRLCGCCF